MSIAKLALLVFVAIVTLAFFQVSTPLLNLVGGVSGIVFIIASLVEGRL